MPLFAHLPPPALPVAAHLLRCHWSPPTALECLKNLPGAVLEKEQMADGNITTPLRHPMVVEAHYTLGVSVEAEKSDLRKVLPSYTQTEVS